MRLFIDVLTGVISDNKGKSAVVFSYLIKKISYLTDQGSEKKQRLRV